MARIAGVNLPTNKRVVIALTYIHGIGSHKATEILKTCSIDGSARVNTLSEDEVARIREVIDRDHIVEGDLRREVAMNIKRLMDLVAIADCVTVRVCRFGVSGPTRTPVPVRVRPKRSPVRRSNRLYSWKMFWGDHKPAPCMIGGTDYGTRSRS